EGVTHRWLEVSHAFHSPLMDPMLDEFGRIAAGVRFDSPSMPFVSTVTGAVETDRVSEAAYWVDHVRPTVRFGAAVDVLADLGVDTFVELGPQPTLLGLVGRRSSDATLLPSLRKGRPDDEQALESLAALWTKGWEPAWGAVRGGRDAGLADVPTYPFQRSRHW